jgi:hypothetical protein
MYACMHVLTSLFPPSPSPSPQIVSSAVLSRTLRILQTRLDLKYEMGGGDGSLRSRAASCLLRVYRRQRCPIPLRTRLLTTCHRLCKNKRHAVQISPPLDWEFHWEEVISLCTRSKKYEEIGSEVVLGKLMQSQVAFLHSARRFLSEAEAGRVAERAMCQLRDTRFAASVEGVFLMVICLPTAFQGYGRYLTEWLALWSTIEHNPLWDASWLTLLCRARKSPSVYADFDWSPIVPFLFTKTKELLQLPGAVSNRPLNSASYPTSVPGHYLFLGSTSPFDSRKTSLHKVAKLLYFQCFYSFRGAPFEIVPADPLSIAPTAAPAGDAAPQPVSIPGLNASCQSTTGGRDLASFYNSIRVYFHPSNTGGWSQDLGFLLGTQIGELARHVGREVAVRHGDLSAAGVAGMVRLPLLENTTQYLIGMFSSLLLEMLYSKNFILSHIAAHALKNLAPLCPALSSAILPTLIATLDPSAVSKSHMALPAMNALSITFKSFLFPQPIALEYLPTVLNLALPGLDPNDNKKTLMTLNLYCRILAWIPIGESFLLAEGKAVDLLSLAGCESGVASVRVSNVQGLFENAKAATLQWAPAFTDKMLTLLDSTEDSNQANLDGSGAKGRRHRSGTSRQGQHGNHRFQNIEEAFRLFFAAMDDAVADEICSKVLDHLKASTPMHAVKEYTGLMAYMVASHSGILLRKTLSLLLDDNLRSGECSAEKLAFRLHLAGGAVRRATCAELLKEQWFGRCEAGGSRINESAVAFLKPFLEPAYSVRHEDIRVQEAGRKLVRDLLRGLSAVFPLEAAPGAVLGETSPERSNVVAWHVPSSEGIKAAAAILGSCCGAAMTSALAVASAGTSGAAALSKKAAEEEVIACLSVVHACVRGAADILGDGSISGSDVAAAASSAAMEIDAAAASGEDDDEDEGHGVAVVATGLAAVVAGCGDAAVVTQLSQQREEVAAFLVRLHDIMNRSNENNIFQQIGSPESEATAAGVTISPDITALWLRVFEAVVMHRAWLKDATLYKHSFAANKRQTVNSTARYTKRLIERFGCGGGGGGGAAAQSQSEHYANSLYWERYDLPEFSSSDRGMIQYGLISKEYAHSSMRARIHGDASNTNVFAQCLNRLVILVGHDFESIRQDSLHSFKKISGFGWKIEELIKPLIRNLNLVGIKYPVASATVGILCTPLLMKRMVGRWPLMLSFLDAVSGTNATFAAVEEPDKRSRLTESFAAFFVGYVDKWTHLPLSAAPDTKHLGGLSERASAELFLRKVLDEALELSPAVPPELAILSPRAIAAPAAAECYSSAATADPSAAIKGMRHELYVAYEVMHLIGHRDIPPPTEAWLWSIRQICTRRGHPVAHLGMAVLTRLAYAAAISTASGERGDMAPRVTVPPAVVEILGSAAVWSALLEGLSGLGVKKEGDSAQWSGGIDRMLRSADYIQQGFPRWVTSCFFLNRSAGGAFRPSEAALIACLLVISPTNGLVHSNISAILEASKSLPATNEEETKGNNALRANLFGALCRVTQAAYAVRNAAGANASADPALDAVDAMLLDFLLQQTKSISLAYCHDWADALTFGFSSSRVHVSGSGAIPGALLSNTRTVLSSLSQSDSSQADDADAASVAVDGFAGHAKDLLLVKGLLNADLAVVSSSGSEDFESPAGASSQSQRQHFLPVESISSVLFSLRHVGEPAGGGASSEVATALVEVFLDEGCSVVSPYRSVREKVVEILNLLSFTHMERSTAELKPVVLRLNSLADLSRIAAADSSSESSGPAGADLATRSKSRSHNAIEIAVMWLEYADSNLLHRSAELLGGLLRVAMVGSGCGDIDLAKRCHTASLRAATLIARGVSSGGRELSKWPTAAADSRAAAEDIFASALASFIEHSKNESWRVRITAILCTSISLHNNWMSMSVAERKACKDVFNNAFYDQKPEIQLLARTGMTAYLSTKLASELNQLAIAYTKNNEIFAARLVFVGYFLLYNNNNAHNYIFY